MIRAGTFRQDLLGRLGLVSLRVPALRERKEDLGLLVRALKHAETAHDSTGIGLAHYELGQCYRQVGDLAILREHITKAASALHAAGDRRNLALVHSLSGVSLAQLGRNEEAMAALRQAERLAATVQADDVLAIVGHELCGHRLQGAREEDVQEQRFDEIVGVMAERNFRRADFLRDTIQNTTAEPGTE